VCVCLCVHVHLCVHAYVHVHARENAREQKRAREGGERAEESVKTTGQERTCIDERQRTKTGEQRLKRKSEQGRT